MTARTAPVRPLRRQGSNRPPTEYRCRRIASSDASASRAAIASRIVSCSAKLEWFSGGFAPTRRTVPKDTIRRIIFSWSNKASNVGEADARAIPRCRSASSTSYSRQLAHRRERSAMSCRCAISAAEACSAASRAMAGSKTARARIASAGLMSRANAWRPPTCGLSVRSATNVPLPTWRHNTPSATRISSALRSDDLRKPSSGPRCRSGGKRSPGAKPPSIMNARSCDTAAASETLWRAALARASSKSTRGCFGHLVSSLSLIRKAYAAAQSGSISIDLRTRICQDRLG